jgi:hypothetical protein
MKSLLLFLALSASAIAADTATITVFREDAGTNQVWTKDPTAPALIIVDGFRVGKISKNQYLTLNLTPGKHTVKTSMSEELTFDLAPGQNVILRPRMDKAWRTFRGHQVLDVIECVKAEAVLQTAKPLKGSAPPPSCSNQSQ